MTQSLQSYPVWDRPTRWFHWINFVCVVALAAIGTAILFDNELGVTDGGKILLKTTHVWFGYVFAVNLAWRVAWAFIGNRHASWSAILPFRTGYGAAFATYLRGLIRGDVRPYLGHNPVARAMVSIFFFLLMLQAITGLVLAGTDIYYPPFGRWIASWIAAPGIDPSTIVPYDKTGIDPNIVGGNAVAPLSIFDCPLLEFLCTSVRDRDPYRRSGRDRAARRWRHRLCHAYGAEGIRSGTNGRCRGKYLTAADHEVRPCLHAARVFPV